MNLREAAQQALEALESDPVALNAINNACAFLRAALAEPVQEPVAGNTLLKEFLAAGKAAGVTHLRLAEPVQEPVAHLYRDHNGQLQLNCIQPPPHFSFPVYTAPPQPLNLSDSAVQKRLAAQWGYVKENV